MSLQNVNIHDILRVSSDAQNIAQKCYTLYVVWPYMQMDKIFISVWKLLSRNIYDNINFLSPF